MQLHVFLSAMKHFTIWLYIPIQERSFRLIQFWILSPILRSVPRVLKMCHPRCGALSVGARVHLPCTGKCLHHSRRCSPGLRRTDTENYIIMKLLTRLNPSLRVSNITPPTHHSRPYWLNKVWHNSNCVKRTAPIMFTYLDWNAFLFFWTVERLEGGTTSA